MGNEKKIYVAATRQNDGKTITALGLLHALGEHFPRIGYIKPVGQQVRLIGDKKIDKDATLMNEIFHIGDPLPDMSPIAVPEGFTRDYILNGDPNTLRNLIHEAFLRSGRNKDIMVIEGTGHAGVGSVFDLSNAVVAKLLGAKVILVTCAGIGRPIDEVMLNKALFDKHGVEIIGVVVNKVKMDKLEEIDKFARLGFKRLGINVLGVVPFFPILSSPTMRELLEDLKGELICGEENIDESVTKMIIGAMPAHSALDFFKDDALLITPGDRDDLVLAAIICNNPALHTYNVKGIILTCGVLPHKRILEILKTSDIPTILVKDDTYATAQKINNIIIKIRVEDKEKINKVKEVIKEYVDIDYLIERL